MTAKGASIWRDGMFWNGEAQRRMHHVSLVADSRPIYSDDGKDRASFSGCLALDRKGQGGRSLFRTQPGAPPHPEGTGQEDPCLDVGTIEGDNMGSPAPPFCAV